MLSSFLLSLREGAEAALVIGIVLGALRKIGRGDCERVVWAAVLGAVATSVLAAVALHAVGWSLEGPAEPIFEGVTLLVAAGLLTWMIAWMARQSRELKAGLEAGVRQAVCTPGRRGVFALTLVAVAREGIELAVFLTASAFESGAAQTIGGLLLGLATAALFGWLLFACTWRLNLRWFFRVTSALLLFFAAGLIAKGVHEFNEIGWVSAVNDPVWDSASILSEQSLLGGVLKTLFGYTSHPSLTAAAAYLVYLGAIVFGLRFASTDHKAAACGAGEPARLVGGVAPSRR
jgi:high-affinity iron transporter